VPNILLQGESIGGSDDIHALHEQGELKSLFTDHDVRVAGKV
jgi:glutaredoxin-related protein